MQKTINWFGGLLLVVTLFSGCGGDNAHDGTGLLAVESSGSEEAFLKSIQENILQDNADAFVLSLSTMETTLKAYKQDLTSSDVQNLQSSFLTIMQNWKAVESTYVAGSYDRLLIDTPRLIEFFIKAIEAIAKFLSWIFA